MESTRENLAAQIGILRQIQHLLLIRDEDTRMGDGSRQDDLRMKSEKLIAQLDTNAAALHTRLAAKNRIFMAPVSKGNCSACGLKIPTASLQHVISKDRFEMCANCGRILYIPDVKATGLRTEQPDPKFLLSRFSSAKLAISNLKAVTAEAAIRELCELMTKERIISDADAVVHAAIERERLMTTAIGHGIAFPHMRGVEEGLLTFAVGVSTAGIEWGESGEKVHLVFFTALPVIASPFYLKLISAIAKTFEDGEKMPFILSAADAKTLWKELNKAVRTNVKDIV